MTKRIGPHQIDPVDDTGSTVSDASYGLAVVGGKVTGLTSATAGLADPTTTKGDLIARGSSAPPTRLAVGSDGLVLTADSTQALGVKWAASSGETLPVTIIDAKGDLIVGTAADTAVRLGVGSNDYVLTADSGVTDGVKWAPAPGAGGGTVRDRRWYVGSGETSVDEFNDASIDAAWIRVDKSGTTGNVVWTENADVLSVSTGPSVDVAGDIHAMMRPLSSIGGSLATGDAFIVGMKIANTSEATGNTFGGILFADGVTFGAGNQVLDTVHIGSTRSDILRSYTNYSSAAGGTVIDTLTGVFGGVLRYERLVFLGSNTWRRDYSMDAVTWMKGTSGSKTMTATHVGLAASSWGTSILGAISYECLRRVSGIT